MDVIARIDNARAEINVLEHPFYERWSAGELSAEELTRYTAEYQHAVVAIARASERAAEKAGAADAPGLRRHAEEEFAHVALWEEFARATGSDADAVQRPLAQTRACAEAWTAGASLLEHLAVLYAIEASQPQISRTKLDGLTAHYGFSEEGPATEYFRLHELRDVDHAREAGELIERLIGESEDPEAAADSMLEHATAALRGNWLLLDGVEASS
jgi:pyrroloquinoline-quinone synthase